MLCFVSQVISLAQSLKNNFSQAGASACADSLEKLLAREILDKNDSAVQTLIEELRERVDMLAASCPAPLPVTGLGADR